MSTSSSRTPPTAVAWLGYGGLVPFVGLTCALLVDPSHAHIWAQALLAYGAVILSFVGALHWGIAMVVPQAGTGVLYVWSVVPSLLAWAGLLVATAGLPGGAVGLMVAGFVAHYRMDLRLSRLCSVLPAWYLPLRLRLTTVAVLCLVLVAVRTAP
jgi:hypothetical protein